MDRHSFARGYNNNLETPQDVIDKEEHLKQLFAEYFEKYLALRRQMQILKDKEKRLNREYKEYGLKITKIKAAAQEYMRRAQMSDEEKENEEIIFDWVNKNQKLRNNLVELLVKNPDEAIIREVELNQRIADRLSSTREYALQRDQERGIEHIDYQYARTKKLIQEGWTSPKAFKELQRLEDLREKRNALIENGEEPTDDLVEPQTTEQFRLVDKQRQSINHDEGRLYDGNYYIPEWLAPFQEEATKEREVSDYVSADWWELGKVMWELKEYMKKNLKTHLPWELSKLREINPRELCLEEILNLREIGRWVAVNTQFQPIQNYEEIENLIDERTKKIEDKTLDDAETLIETIGKYQRSYDGYCSKQKDVQSLIDTCEAHIRDNENEAERAKYRATLEKANIKLDLLNQQIEENGKTLEELKALQQKNPEASILETEKVCENPNLLLLESENGAKRDYGNTILWQKQKPWMVGEPSPVDDYGDYMGELRRKNERK